MQGIFTHHWYEPLRDVDIAFTDPLGRCLPDICHCLRTYTD